MKEFLLEYVKIIAYTIVGLLFGYACFYLFVNCYHYQEVRKDYVVDVSNTDLYKRINNNITLIENNIQFNPNGYKGTADLQFLLALQGKLSICTRKFNNDAFKEIGEKTAVSIMDVSKLRTAFQNDVVSSCVVEQLYFLTTLEKDGMYDVPEFDVASSFIKLDINALLHDTSYVEKDILNNSSYFFNTDIINQTVRHNTKDAYQEVMRSYSDAVDLALTLSEWVKEEVNK